MHCKIYLLMFFFKLIHGATESDLKLKDDKLGEHCSGKKILPYKNINCTKLISESTHVEKSCLSLSVMIPTIIPTKIVKVDGIIKECYLVSSECETLPMNLHSTVKHQYQLEVCGDEHQSIGEVFIDNYKLHENCDWYMFSTRTVINYKSVMITRRDFVSFSFSTGTGIIDNKVVVKDPKENVFFPSDRSFAWEPLNQDDLNLDIALKGMSIEGKVCGNDVISHNSGLLLFSLTDCCITKYDNMKVLATKNHFMILNPSDFNKTFPHCSNTSYWRSGNLFLEMEQEEMYEMELKVAVHYSMCDILRNSGQIEGVKNAIHYWSDRGELGHNRIFLPYNKTHFSEEDCINNGNYLFDKLSKSSRISWDREIISQFSKYQVNKWISARDNSGGDNSSDIIRVDSGFSIFFWIGLGILTAVPLICCIVKKKKGGTETRANRPELVKLRSVYAREDKIPGKRTLRESLFDV